MPFLPPHSRCRRRRRWAPTAGRTCSPPWPPCSRASRPRGSASRRRRPTLPWRSRQSKRSSTSAVPGAGHGCCVRGPQCAQRPGGAGSSNTVVTGSTRIVQAACGPTASLHASTLCPAPQARALPHISTSALQNARFAAAPAAPLPTLPSLPQTGAYSRMHLQVGLRSVGGEGLGPGRGGPRRGPAGEDTQREQHRRGWAACQLLPAALRRPARAAQPDCPAAGHPGRPKSLSPRPADASWTGRAGASAAAADASPPVGSPVPPAAQRAGEEADGSDVQCLRPTA